MISVCTEHNYIKVHICLLQEGCLPLGTLWNAVRLSPRKTHAIFLGATYNAAKVTEDEK